MWGVVAQGIGTVLPIVVKSILDSKTEPQVKSPKNKQPNQKQDEQFCNFVLPTDKNFEVTINYNPDGKTAGNGSQNFRVVQNKPNTSYNGNSENRNKQRNQNPNTNVTQNNKKPQFDNKQGRNQQFQASGNQNGQNRKEQGTRHQNHNQRNGNNARTKIGQKVNENRQECNQCKRHNQAKQFQIKPIERQNGNAKKRRTWIYLGRLKYGTTAKDLTNFLNEKFYGHRFIVQELPLYKDAKLPCFKVEVDDDILAEFKNPDNWPAGVTIKNFIENFKLK